MSKKLLTPLLLIPMFLSFLPVSFAESFSDVNVGDKYYISISYLQEHGIIEGYEDNTFRPYEDINRSEALKMLTLASGIFTDDMFEETEEEIEEDVDEEIDEEIEEEVDEEVDEEPEEEQPFTDTSWEQWFTPYLAAAKDYGIIEGYSDGSFQPFETINLVETLKIFLESYDDIDYSKTEEYLVNDTPLYEWFSKYTAYAVEQNLINIYSTNTITPDQDMTRGYMAEIIYRKIMTEKGYEFGKATWYGAALQGNYTASGEIFDYHQMTAAHLTLPFGTIVEVTNLANGESIQVEITDRGPYGPGRVIDLTSAAFKEIASLGAGVIYVQYEIIE